MDTTTSSSGRPQTLRTDTPSSTSGDGTAWVELADPHARAPAELGAGATFAAVGLMFVTIGLVLALGSDDEADVELRVSSNRLELARTFR